MMRTTVVHCDKCGQVIHGQPAVLTGLGTFSSLEHVDLCQRCSDRLLEWLRTREDP
jgi:hypothetical protein